LLAAGLLSAAIGMVVGLPSLRIKGLYLAIATLAASVFLHFVFVEWASVTGGMAGLSLRSAQLFGLTFHNDFRMYFMIMPLAVLMLLRSEERRVGREGRSRGALWH